MRIAAILTCFNRKDKTKNCLESLFSILPTCDVYITDDASTDGTSEMLHENIPRVHVINGTGNLFWSRGMYMAWNEAVKGDYDFYLWLNDDIVLYDNFITELIFCSNLYNSNCVVSGLVENMEHTKILYGGTSFGSNKKVQPSSQPEKIHHMNGNVVLVPRSVVLKIGILDPFYHHDLGDVDYGLRAIEHGIPVISTRIPIAYGYPNHICRVRKWGTSLYERFKILNTPLGSPLKINFYFRKKHYSLCNAFLFSVKLIIINVLSDNLIYFLCGNKYKNKN